MTSQPEVTTFWGRLGSFWWQKHFLEKKERAQMLFQFLRSSLWSMLHQWRILQNVLSLFHFYELLVLTVNSNHYELGLITSISARLGTKDLGKNTDNPDFHHGWSVGRPGFFAALFNFAPLYSATLTTITLIMLWFVTFKYRQLWQLFIDIDNCFHMFNQIALLVLSSVTQLTQDIINFTITPKQHRNTMLK